MQVVDPIKVIEIIKTRPYEHFYFVQSVLMALSEIGRTEFHCFELYGKAAIEGIGNHTVELVPLDSTFNRVSGRIIGVVNFLYSACVRPKRRCTVIFLSGSWYLYFFIGVFSLLHGNSKTICFVHDLSYLFSRKGAPIGFRGIAAGIGFFLANRRNSLAHFYHVDAMVAEDACAFSVFRGFGSLRFPYVFSQRVERLCPAGELVVGIFGQMNAHKRASDVNDFISFLSSDKWLDKMQVRVILAGRDPDNLLHENPILSKPINDGKFVCERKMLECQQECSVVLVPMSVEKYYLQSSGVVMDCIRLAKPMLFLDWEFYEKITSFFGVVGFYVGDFRENPGQVRRYLDLNSVSEVVHSLVAIRAEFSLHALSAQLERSLSDN